MVQGTLRVGGGMSLPFKCPYCHREFEAKTGLGTHLGHMHKEHYPQPIDLPVKCIHCREMITKRGRQADSLFMGNIDGERQPFHRGCFMSVYNPMKNPETAAKMSKIMTGRIFSPEHRANVVKAMRLPETRAKISKTLTGKPLSLEHRAKISKAKTGYKHTSETCVKISKAKKGKLTGDKNPMRNPKHFDTWRKAISQRPNKEEARLASILEGFGFIYHKKIEILRSPDFVHKSEKRIIEYDGYMGHNPAHPWTPNTWEEIFIRDDRRDQQYHDAGYYVLSIFPEDLAEGDDFVRDKVEEWMLQ